MNAKLTPVMRQYHAVKQQFPDAIVLFRMGDFYEMFGEDAVLAAPILEIVLTSRDRNADDKMPMCGVPFHSVDSYISRLIARNYKVAICEQVEDAKASRGLISREVVRVITPGTLLETNLLDGRDNNYIASVARAQDRFGIAVMDLSTGEFNAMELPDASNEGALQMELGRWNPREVLVPSDWNPLTGGEACRVTQVEPWVFSAEYASDRIRDQYKVSGLDGFGLEALPAALTACGALLHYLQASRVQDLGHLQHIRIVNVSEFLHIDAASRRNLELTRTMLNGTREGSLLHYLDDTVTSMGARLLKRRLEQPLRDAAAIRARLDRVDVLFNEDTIRRSIRESLRSIADMERLISRISTRVAHGRDLAALRDSLLALPALIGQLRASGSTVLTGFAFEIDPLETIRELLNRAIVDNPPLSVKEGNMIRDGYREDLDQLKLAARDGKSWIATLQHSERERTGIPTLKVSYNRVFGYYIEVSKGQISKVPPDYIRRQTMTNGERYVTPKLKEMEELILGAEEKMAALEFELFCGIRDTVAAEAQRIQATARALADLDVAAALAELAVRRRYSRPGIHEDDTLRIQAGRHPVVEQITSSQSFVSNDVHLDSDERRLIILTGPNMAGKSTYIRQIALIVLMAQMGSFVPAEQAQIGVADRIFTRVGAADNLAGGQSTFMVEMAEAANILNNASSRSLVILDEIGRGTSTFDGLSIAWAVAEYLHGIRARTLFATHYHELTDLADQLPGVRNFNIEVREWNDQVVFLRRVVPGGVDRSYGIQVARLAGIPQSVLARAKEVLAELERKESGRLEVPARRIPPPQKVIQLELFSEPMPDCVDELRRLKVESLTPLDALNLIARWKSELSG